MPLYPRNYFVGNNVNWCEIATRELSKYHNKPTPISPLTFTVLFGVVPSTAQSIHFIHLLPTHLCAPKYLLWTLYFLKHYPIDGIGHQIFINSNTRTFRDKVWEVIFFLSKEMDEVKLNAAQFDADDDRVIVDTTEVQVASPSVKWKQNILYSGYKKKVTLKYEVVISENTHHPIYYNGPFAGPTGDITIFRMGLKKKMDKKGWFGIADGTYQGEPLYLEVPPRPFRGLTAAQRLECRRRSKKRVFVEIFIKRLKNFKCLKHVWRHHLQRHGPCFRVIMHVVAVDIRFRPMRK